MKKVLLFVCLTVAMTLGAQEVQLTNGIYEQKKVFAADSVNAGTLYSRALEALSDWAGSLKNSKIGIDVQDKDAGLVVYKGEYYLGYGKRNMMYGWDTYANFTLKIRCKDGKTQVTITVPSFSFYWTADRTKYTVPTSELLPKYAYSGDATIKRAGTEIVPKMPNTFNLLIDTIGKRIIEGNDDDDF